MLRVLSLRLWLPLPCRLRALRRGLPAGSQPGPNASGVVLGQLAGSGLCHSLEGLASAAGRAGPLALARLAPRKFLTHAAAGASRSAWLPLPGAMSAASSADVGAEHGYVLPGGVKREGPLLPAVVRRVRLRGKTRPGVCFGNDSHPSSQSPSDFAASGPLAESGISGPVSSVLTEPRGRTEFLLSKAALARYKRWAVKHIIHSCTRGPRFFEAPMSKEAKELLDREWKEKYKPDPASDGWREHMRRWRESPLPRPSKARPEEEVQQENHLVAESVQTRRERRESNGQRVLSALCTYNGDWGKITDWSVSERLLDEVSVLRQDRTPQERQAIAVTNMCDELLTRSPQLATLWKGLRDRLPPRLQAMHIFQWACSLELCPHTFLDSRVLRVHVHLFVHFGGGKRQLSCFDKELRLFGTRPRVSTHQSGHMLQARTCGPNAAMYYLQCPKIGMLHWMGSALPFSGYLVNGEWIMNMVQGGKMDAGKARGEIVKTAKRLSAMLDNLDRWVRETRSAHLRMVEAALRIELTKKAQPFRTLEPVAQWQTQYAQDKQRYKFLVLDGLSGMGKTQFAHSLASAPGAALDINMASAPEPDLRDYRSELHEVIIMDEITPEKVLAQKKLFQAGPSEVGLAASATSCHAYKVWVWRKRFVCCSNIWRQRVRQLCDEDQEWINANSVLVVVSEPLWVT